MTTKFFLLVFTIICSTNLLAEVTQKGALNLYIENDTRDLGGPGSDNAYTNGFKLSFVAAENQIPNWATFFIEASTFLKDQLKESQSNFGISFGHKIFTPNDIRASELITDDRPYAAWMYLGFSAHFENAVRSHTFELDIGLIGPAALGENVQNGYHKMIKKYLAEGWKNQLRNEPTLQLSYQQRLSFFQLNRTNSKYKYLDLVPFFGASAGNVEIKIHSGLMIRLGQRLPNDFGPSRPSQNDGDHFTEPQVSHAEKTYFYGFMAGRANFVARNIFLDGNTFGNSHSVSKNPFVFETELGFVGNLDQFSATWSFVTRSPEFKERSAINSFASISLGYTY